jgi:hypothetical protein
MAKKAAANVGQASRLSPKSEKNEVGSFCRHCGWHVSHHVRAMLDLICGENNFVLAAQSNRRRLEK